MQNDNTEAPLGANTLPKNLGHALSAADRGFRLIPVNPKTKAPYLADWPNRGTSDPLQLKRWFLVDFPDAVPGIVTGNGLLAVDVDVPKPGKPIDGRIALAKLEQEHGPLGEPFQHSPSGGPHYLFSYDPALNPRNSVSTLGPGIDIRANGGQVVLYGEATQPVTPAPQWLLDKLTRPNLRVVAPTYDVSDLSVNGKRNDAAFSFALKLARVGCDGDMITAALRAGGSTLSVPELMTVVSSAMRHATEQATATIELIDDNAALLSDKNDLTPRVIPMTDLLAAPKLEHRFVVDKLLIDGGVSILAGKPKAGKSTLLETVVWSVAHGIPCLTRDTLQGPVIYCSIEGHPQEIAEHFRGLGATGSEPIYFFFGPVPKAGGGLPWLREQITTYAPRLIVIDKLGECSKFLDIANYAEVGHKLAEYRDLMRQSGGQLIFGHHSTKSVPEDPFDSILGSTELLGEVDTALVLRRDPDNSRYITSRQRSRYGLDLDWTQLVLDPESGLTTLGYDKVVKKRLDELNRVLAVMSTSEGLDRPTIAKAVPGMANGDVDAALLRQLVSLGYVKVTGLGVKGSPRLYTRVREHPVRLAEVIWNEEAPSLTEPEKFS